MASTWSALQIELLETGANSGTWGTATNVNLGDAVLGEAITGSATVDFPADADVTVTLTNSATSQAARNLRLNITESSSGVGSVRNLILGAGCQIEKFYLVKNNGTGAKTIKNTSGTGISVPANKSTLVYNDGTNVVDGASYFTSLTLGSALPVASGGTGLTAGTSGGVLAYTASGTLASSGALTASALVLGGGAGVAPTPMGSLGTTTTVLHGNAGGAPTFGAVSLTADVSGTLPANNGGTGVANNAASTLTISGSFGTTLTVSGTTGVTLPTTGTLATLAGTETFTNKTLTSPILTTPQLGTPSQGVLSSCTVDGTNKVGYLNIPNSGAKTTSYTLVIGDVGKFIELGTGGTVVVPASVFAAGDAISIFNNTSASITCTCSAVTDVYKGGTDADISTFGVTTRGVATILFITATRAVVTGNLV